MANPYVTGPAHFIVAKTNAAGAISNANYLGTVETTPNIQVRPGWEPVYNDIGGTVLFDQQFMGEEALVSGIFNRYNESTLALLQARPSVSSKVRGSSGPFDVGALMGYQGLTWTLYVIFPFVQLGVYSSTGMPNGYRFLNAYLMGPDDFQQLGTRHRKNALIFHCMRVYIPATQSFTLYDSNVPLSLLKLVN